MSEQRAIDLLITGRYVPSGAVQAAMADIRALNAAGVATPPTFSPGGREGFFSDVPAGFMRKQAMAMDQRVAATEAAEARIAQVQASAAAASEALYQERYAAQMQIVAEGEAAKEAEAIRASRSLAAIEAETQALQLERDGEYLNARIVRLETYYAERMALVEGAERQALAQQLAVAKDKVAADALEQPAAGAGFLGNAGLLKSLGTLYLIHQGIRAISEDFKAVALAQKGAAQEQSGHIEDAYKTYQSQIDQLKSSNFFVAPSLAIRNFFTGEVDDIERANEAIEDQNAAFERTQKVIERNRQALHDYLQLVSQISLGQLGNEGLRAGFRQDGLGKSLTEEDYRFYREQAENQIRANEQRAKLKRDLDPKELAAYDKLDELAQERHRLNRQGLIDASSDTRNDQRLDSERQVTASLSEMEAERLRTQGQDASASVLILNTELADKLKLIDQARQKAFESPPDNMSEAQKKTWTNTIGAFFEAQAAAAQSLFGFKIGEAQREGMEKQIGRAESVAATIRRADIEYRERAIELSAREGQIISNKTVQEIERLRIADEYTKRKEDLDKLIRDPATNAADLESLRRERADLDEQQKRAEADVGRGLLSRQPVQSVSLGAQFGGLAELFQGEVRGVQFARDTAENTKKMATDIGIIRDKLAPAVGGTNATAVNDFSIMIA